MHDAQAFFIAKWPFVISEPAADSYCALAEREAKHRVIVLDPNIRPSFIIDEKAYRARISRMMTVESLRRVSAFGPIFVFLASILWSRDYCEACQTT